MIIDGNTKHIGLFSICREDFTVSVTANESVSDSIISGIEKCGMTLKEFAKKSGVSESSIIRYKMKKTEPNLEVIVAYCITVHTNIFDALYLISKAGYNIFCSDDKKVYLILLILSRYFKINVKIANDLLIELGMKPLNKLHTTNEDNHNVKSRGQV